LRIAIVGSRDINDMGWFKDFVHYGVLEEIEGPNTYQAITIISGGARGVDTLARDYAHAMDSDFIMFKPYHLIDNKVPYEPKYFFVRNKQIVDNSDVVIAVWDGKSKGTEDVIRYSKKRKKPLYVVEYPSGTLIEKPS